MEPGLDGNWHGFSLVPRRETLAAYDTMKGAINGVEYGELGGPLCEYWKSQSGTPQRDGWKHAVQYKRDTWQQITAENKLLFVMQAPVNPATFPQSLRYVAAVNAQILLREDGQPRNYACPVLAMESAERNAIRQGLTLTRFTDPRTFTI